MRRTLLFSTILLGFSTVASAESRLVVGAPTRDGLTFGRFAIPDDNTPMSARAASRTVYLNKNGVTLMPGASDSRTNKSSIIGAQSTIPAWNASSTLWSQTVTCLREMFAPFDVAITETDPGPNVHHIEAVFGGSPQMIGMPGNMAGVSPFSSSCKIIEDSIVFTFTDMIPQSAKVACEVMAQEIAHSYGLDHELLASDPMTYLPYSGNRTFQNQTASCGESTPRPCGLAGSPACRADQNSYALLMERIGKAGTGDIDAPNVAITSPADGAIVDAGFAIAATVTDDVTVKFAALAIDGTSLGSLTQAPWTFTAPANLAPGKHTIEIKATDGANEKVATIEITVRGAESDDSDEMPIGGCSSSNGTGGMFGLLFLALVAIQRRAQR